VPSSPSPLSHNSRQARRPFAAPLAETAGRNGELDPTGEASLGHRDHVVRGSRHTCRVPTPPMPRGPSRHDGSDFSRRLGSELHRRKLWAPDAGVRPELETTADLETGARF